MKWSIEQLWKQNLGKKNWSKKSRNSGKGGGEALNVKVATEAIVIIRLIVYFLQNQHILVFFLLIITTSNKFWPPRIYGFASFQSQPDFYNKKLQSIPPPAINQKHHDDRHHEGNWRPGMSRPTSRSRGWWCIKLQLGNAGMATIDLPVSSHASSTSATLAVTLMTRPQSHCSHLQAAPANNRPLLFLVSSPVHLLLFLQISQRL